MMIKAIIIIHLWSLVVAGCAWVLQRDGGEQVGAKFPGASTWLILIGLSILPSAIYLAPFSATISMPIIADLELAPLQVSEVVADAPGPLTYLSVYIGLGILLMGRTLWRWSRLQNLALMPTEAPDIFTTHAEIPPLTLSWPRRAVVVPAALHDRAALIQHERAHLRHYDAELTLLLLLLQDMMLRNPGVCYLVRQWRLSTELRADHAAVETLTQSERKDYAALLLNGLRATEPRAVGPDLPCPTAQLSSTHLRSVKMRLTKIVERKSAPRKYRWSAALLLTAMGASLIGFLSIGASANEAVPNATSEVVYLKRTAAQLPASCPGLEMDKANIATVERVVDGALIQQFSAKLGLVVVHLDVLKDGRTDKLYTTYSTHPCFEANAKASVAEWIAEPQDQVIRDVGVKVHFIITGTSIEDIKSQLDKLTE